MKGKVFIVGAGPGDPELITVKGLRLLKKADVIVYDRLVSKRLLREAKSNAETVFVGKAPKLKTLPQEEINRLMIERAKKGKLVVRLKGGDPMVLGRGGEEMVALARAGVDFEVVPGITSAIAGPAVANIPVTYRGVSSSFAVATGKEDVTKPERQVNLRKLGRAVDTIVVLMGLGKLAEVCKELLEGGLSTTTPAAIIKDATTKRQMVLEGTLGDIAEKAKKAKLKPPVVLIVGRVVLIKRELEALRGREKIILTVRPKETAGELEELLSRAGYACVNVSAASVKPALNVSKVKKTLSKADYVAFTSQVSVKELEEKLGHERLSDILSGMNVVAIGSKTKEALKRRNVKVEVVPKSYRSSELAKLIVSQGISGAKVVLFRSADADKSVEEELKKAGAEVHTIHTHKLEPSKQLSTVVELLKGDRVRAIILTSSLITKFVDQELRNSGSSLKDLSKRIKIFSIGPVTSRTLRELGVKKFKEAKEHTARGLYKVVVKTLGMGK